MSNRVVNWNRLAYTVEKVQWASNLDQHCRKEIHVVTKFDGVVEEEETVVGVLDSSEARIAHSCGVNFCNLEKQILIVVIIINIIINPQPAVTTSVVTVEFSVTVGTREMGGLFWEEDEPFAAPNIHCSVIVTCNDSN